MTKDEIRQRLAKASSLGEQIRLVAELDALEAGEHKAVEAQRSLDWQDTTVKATLGPGRTLDRHTGASDWLGMVEASQDPGHTIIAEASVWFSGLDADVKADAGEYVEQARGMARRTAGKYGEYAEDAAHQFLDYAVFLNRDVLSREAASGLPQVQQLVDAQENPAQTPLPTDVFDTFQEPIHPINQGVSGTEQNSLAPGAEEAMAESGGAPSAGRPSQHDETGQFEGPAPEWQGPSAKQGQRKLAGMLERARHQATQLGHTMQFESAGGQDAYTGHCTGCGASMGVTASGITEGSTAGTLRCNHQTTAGLSEPSVAIGYTMNMDDFLTAEAAREAGGAAPFVRSAEAKASTCVDCSHGAHGSEPCSADGCRCCAPGESKTAASGLDQVEQTTAPDGVTSRPTSLPTDVMFPVVQDWPEEQAEYDQGGEDTGPTNRPRQASKKTADTWHGGDTPSPVPGGETPVANSPQTTPARSNSGDYNQGMQQGQADARAGERPDFADHSSGTSDFVRGYVEGYTSVTPMQPMQDVPSSMGGDSGQAQNAAEVQRRTEPPLTMAKKKAGRRVHGYKWCSRCMDYHDPGGSYGHKATGGEDPITRSDRKEFAGDNSRERTCNNQRCLDYGTHVPSDHSHALLGKRESGLTLSASLLTKDVSKDEDFKLGYRYARSWKPGESLVARGSDAEEAGIYCGIVDNPKVHTAWVKQHKVMAKDHPELTDRLDEHKQVTSSLVGRSDFVIKGLYPVQAGTSLDLDTMSPVTTPDPQGATPSEGPGTVPVLRGAPGTPAAPGGPAPYNGSEPFGQPVVPNPMLDTGEAPSPQSPDAVNMTGDSSLTGHSPQSMAFRKKVQAARLKMRQQQEAKENS